MSKIPKINDINEFNRQIEESLETITTKDIKKLIPKQKRIIKKILKKQQINKKQLRTKSKRKKAK